MHVIMERIYDTLLGLGYRPAWNASRSGLSFNFNMELAICRMDPDSWVVTFVIPSLYPDSCGMYNDIIGKVNALSNAGRLTNIDGTSVAAVYSFPLFEPDYVDAHVCFAISELAVLTRSFFAMML